MMERKDGEMSEPLVELQDICVTFGGGGLVRKRPGVEAVVKVNLRIAEGEILALVGESGCGKTTLGRVVAGLQKPTSGRMLYRGQDIQAMDHRSWRDYRLGVQIVHQDSFAALNPVRTILHSLTAPLRRHKLAKNNAEARQKAAELLTIIGLTPPELFLDDKYPHQLSGGQRQRVVLARALAVQPRLIVADEPVSMVDVSLRLDILNLMASLNEQFGIAFIYITHDLATARYFARKGRIAVMYLGQIVEVGPLGQVLESPRHPYLQALLAAVPVPDPNIARQRRELPLRSLDLPDPANAPPGCRFHTRCPYWEDICTREIPPLELIEADHYVACHLVRSIPAWHPLLAEQPSP